MRLAFLFLLFIFCLSLEATSDQQIPKAQSPESLDIMPLATQAIIKSKAEGGDSQAQYNLGNIYAYGNRIMKPYHKEAFKWLKLAAGQRHADAQYQLGKMYEIVRENDIEVIKWYRLAAENGHADALAELGDFYRKGQGVNKNLETAIRWYRLVAGKGDYYAQRRLRALQKTTKPAL